MILSFFPRYQSSEKNAIDFTFQRHIATDKSASLSCYMFIVMKDSTKMLVQKPKNQKKIHFISLKTVHMLDQRIIEANHIIFLFFLLFSYLHKTLTPTHSPHELSLINLQDRVLIVQGGYVSQSQGTQLSVTKKSNVLDKPKPNILNSNSKKGSANHDQSNNNNSSMDINDSASTRHHETFSPTSQQQAAPEVTVSDLKL